MKVLTALLSKLKQPWSVMRVLKLGIAVFATNEAIVGEHWYLLAFSAVLFYSGIVNAKFLPCEIAGECSVPTDNTNDKEVEVVYQEVK